jgi:hypothetical protein
MTVFHILLIGAGQLGSRHLQAIALSNLNISISVVDPSEASLIAGKTRFEQIEDSKNINSINFYTSMSKVENEVDLCVLATNADCRLSVLKELLGHLTVKNILFEKVLFQSEEQLDEAQELLAEHNINAWVNCPRRMQPIYKKLKELLKNEDYIKFKVHGDNWGLACNAIHMIDIWAYLMNNTDYELNTQKLLPQLFDSKRKNFKELCGELTGSLGKNEITLKCDINNEGVTVFQSIKTPNYIIKIDETLGFCKIKHLETKQSEIIDFNMIFQSNLTNVAAETIINHGFSDLTIFSESVSLHRPFLKSILEFINDHSDQKYTLCPIT